MPDAGKCVELIVANLQSLKVSVRRHANLPTPTISEEEVSAQSLQKINIEEILRNIKIYEANLEGDLTVELITNLMTLYQ
jgi:hypothetical protein